MEKISVIVPVYNVEDYISRCVDSILEQTFEDFNLILIDDGSPDESGQICDNYSKKDSRIVVIHQENKGLSAARNSGIEWAIEHSESQWLTFIDSDDWVHPRYLELLFKAVEIDKTKISIGGFQYTNSELPYHEIDGFTRVWKTDEYYKTFTVNATVAWGKLYSKECFEEIRYPTGRIHEDEFVTYRILFKYASISVIDEPLYFYFQNDKGITKGTWNPARFDCIDGIEGQIDYFLSMGREDIAHKRFESLLYVIDQNREQVSSCRALGRKLKKQYLGIIRSKLRNTLWKYRHYGWKSIQSDRTVFVQSSLVLSTCRELWLKVKPWIRK